jgi:SlyX protein
METRLVTLETRYTHLERQVDELSQVVFDQQRLVDRLVRELTLLRSRLAGVDDGSDAIVDERPPHY